ncbi:MAG TPA: hypothetical protein VF705_04950, partial [Longimicrobium sp.]
MNPVRSTPAPRRRRAALARALAVAFAGLPVLAAAQQPCKPLGIPAALLSPTTKWSDIAPYLPDAAFTPQADRRVVSPCTKKGTTMPCDSMQATTRAQTQANCVTAAQIGSTDTAYVLGKVKLEAGHGYSNLGLGQSNADSTIYFLVSNGHGITIFHHTHGTVGIRSNQGNGVGWRFALGQDSHSDTAAALWLLSSQNRHRTAMRFQPAGAVRGGPAGLLADDAEMAQMSDPAIGWMTCAPGCCQFHGTPSGGDGDDDEDIDDHPNPHHGHHGQ